LVISFHSLEDRVVKQMFWEKKSQIIETPMANIHLFHTMKTIYPTKEEVEENLASRSAKLRILIKKHE
jgi:16S rRNA (cytosine1402-N4)-methyltransferase